MHRPAVSVVLPVYNAGRTLRETLASLRWQTFGDWEAVCINDGSTDDSGAILNDFANVDPRFRVLQQANSGIVAALNRGLQAARAPWVARLDADDVALPHRLQAQLAFVESEPDIVAVGSAVTAVDPEGQPLRNWRYPTDHAAIEASLLSGGAPIAHPTVLMRRDAALQVGGYRSAYEWVEDADLWLRLACVGRLANLTEPLVRYRLHGGSICATRRDEQAVRLQRLVEAARIERGLPPLARPRRRLRQPSDPRGKWARHAARSGRPRTAAKWCGRLLAQRPLSGESWRVALEAAARCALALATGRREPGGVLPDWRPYDCPPLDEPFAA